MLNVKSGLRRVALAGIAALGAVAAVGAAQAVDIKMWALTNAGYLSLIHI